MVINASVLRESLDWLFYVRVCPDFDQSVHWMWLALNLFNTKTKVNCDALGCSNVVNASYFVESILTSSQTQ